MKHIRNIVLAGTLLLSSFASHAASFLLDGYGDLAGSALGLEVIGTWNLSGTAEYSHGGTLLIDNAQLDLHGTAPIIASVAYRWDSNSYPTGGGNLAGTAQLTDCQTGIGCVLGDRALNIALTQQGSLNWALEGVDAAGTTGDHIRLSGAIVLSAVPLPGAAWLMASALFSLVSYRARYQQPGRIV